MIQNEISFAGMDTVEVERNVVWLKFKVEEHKRKIICKNEEDANSLLLTLKEGMYRYHVEDEQAVAREVTTSVNSEFDNCK